MDPTRAEPPARLLDLTRLISRAGRPFTGVDRVECAYLERLLTEPVPLFALVRTRLGYVLLDPDGTAAIARRIAENDWGPPDALARFSRRADAMRLRAEADLRRNAQARTLPRGAGRMLRRHLPKGVHYLNVGHSNLNDRTVAAVRAVPGSRIAVLVHDTIPLDAPEFQRPGATDRFRAFLSRAGHHADLLICNSAQTASDLGRHLPDTRARNVVAHLGVPVPQPGEPPDGPWRGRPYFVALGTIEPRKNHALLLDIWAQDPPDADLLICGQRGWENHATFARLDAGLPRVHELSGLSDAAVFGLLAQSAGLVQPSLAEGFGLPPVEAAALGVPLVLNDLPVYREILGDIPIYADASDGYLWRTRISELAEDHRTTPRASHRTGGYTPPSWDAHFKVVLTLI